VKFSFDLFRESENGRLRAQRSESKRIGSKRIEATRRAARKEKEV